MPTVVLFRGKAGSGKTTISTEFARQSGFSLIRKDDVYDAAAAKANPKPNQLITDFEKLKAHYQKMDVHGLEGETVLDTVLPLDQLLKTVRIALHMS